MKFVAGILVGAAVATTGSVFAAEIKQYILTPASYPIVVNGTEFNDPVAPILNYEGSTYVPLAKLGDITGVNYTWNDAAKRVEIVTGIAVVKNDASETKVEHALTAVDAQEKYAGYKMLKGYTDSDKYQIYFKGNASSFSVTTEDLRNINLNEMVTWSYKDKEYKTSKKDLHAFFADTSKFKNYLGALDYTFTAKWYDDTFGEVYYEWLSWFGYQNDASRWVEKYFEQFEPGSGSSKVSYNVKPLPDPVQEETLISKVKTPIYEKKNDGTWVGEEEFESLLLKAYREIDRIVIYDTVDGKNKQVHEIKNVPSELKIDVVYDSGGVRYKLGEFNRLFFNRDDLIKIGLIR